MARLQVRYKGKNISSLPLDDSRPYIVGRKEDCDIVLQAEKGISREHFKLESQNGVWFVEVVSRYGDVILNGQKVTERNQLEHGEIITVPPYEFEFSMAMAAGEDVPAEMTQQTAEDFSEEKTMVGVAPSQPYIKIVNELGDIQELFKLDGGDSWVAGREQTAAIVIRDQRVSRRQFEIRKINSNFYITDLGSVNGTIVNGVGIGEDLTPLKSGDTISVLSNILIFELRDPNFSQRMEMVVVPQTPMLHPLGDVSSSHELSVPQQQWPMGMLNENDPNLPAQYHPQNQMVPLQNSSIPMPTMPQGGIDFGRGSSNADRAAKMRPILIAVTILVFIVGYFLKDDGGSKKEGAKTALSNDPLSKLKPEEQLLVKQTYQLAKNYYMSGKYELAQSEINKIYQKVPDYEDVKTIERLSREAIAIQEQKRRQDELQKAKREAEIAIQKQYEECLKKMNPDITVEAVEECLSPVIALEPNHPRIIELKAKAQELTEVRERKAAQNAIYNENVSKLVTLNKKAQAIEVAGNNLESIEAYEKVIASSLPDPRGLKKQAKEAIAKIRRKMNAETQKFVGDADRLYSSQNLKGAILSLRRALKVDPRNLQLQDKIDQYMSELRKQMMVLYQEGILEESFGNVEGSDSKPGAKDKWKKIIELDVTDGEYYKKAYIKLKKYGAL